jgi:serine/threonine protein kinase/tetratricopeptide (TPR) repeat protein
MSDPLKTLQTAVGERYSIERELGRGAMATVYLAQDRRHERPVALKVLHPEFAKTLGAERFLREIQIAARLQHPHIVSLYDSGHAGDTLYYVMPYLEGESLHQRLEREGRLPLEVALRIVRSVAAALDYAHKQGVVHRDIKPENVMLHHGEAMVTDFGIAKAASEAASERLTQTGTAIGTPAYMSPEQLEGAADLDGRSDIYSIGAMLYEMLAGEVPFPGTTVQSVVTKILTEPVPPLRAARGDIPPWVEECVLRAMSKSPGDRYPSASALSQVLARPAGTTPEPGSAAKSIAVLPFVNMSPDPDNEYFSDGVAEEIINALTKVRALRVASRTSAFAFKGKNLDIRDVGEKLGVNTVLEGSVRKAGDRLRVTAQLIDITDGYHLWSERYDRLLDDVFAIQDEIAENIVGALEVVLSEEERRAIEKPSAENVEAYQFYLRGRQYYHQFRRSGVLLARRMYEKAIEIDPNYAKAHAAVADCCSFLYMYWDTSRANLDAAHSASLRALALDPELAEGHASRGFALSLNREYDAARVEFETALQLNPMLYEAHYFYARACVQEGKLEEAVSHYEDSAKVRPEDFQALFLMHGPLRRLGRLEESDEVLRRGLKIAEKHLELNPDDARALYLSAIALIQQGAREKALERAELAYTIDSSEPVVLYNVACVHALGGMPDKAIDYLDQAIQNGFGHREWIDNDSDLDSLRDHPRFQSLRQKI